MRKELIKLANHFDRLGEFSISDKIDSILKSAQQSVQTDELGNSPDSSTDFYTPKEKPADGSTPNVERAHMSCRDIVAGIIEEGKRKTLSPGNTELYKSFLTATKKPADTDIISELENFRKAMEQVLVEKGYELDRKNLVLPTFGRIDPPLISTDKVKEDLKQGIAKFVAKAPSPEGVPSTSTSYSTVKDRVKAIQGLTGAKVDGDWGPETNQKILEFLDKHKSQIEGTNDPQLLSRITSQWKTAAPEVKLTGSNSSLRFAPTTQGMLDLLTALKAKPTANVSGPLTAESSKESELFNKTASVIQSITDELFPLSADFSKFTSSVRR